MIDEKQIKQDFERWTNGTLCLTKDERGEFEDAYTFAAWKWYELGYKVGSLGLNDTHVVQLEGNLLDAKIDKQGGL